MGSSNLLDNSTTNLSETIEDSEQLYRGIKNDEIHWNEKQQRLTSAVFKSSHGLSVDRCGRRGDEALLSVFASRMLGYGLAALLTLECRNSNTNPIAKPIDNNQFHAEIHGQGKIELTKGQSRALSKSARIVSNPLV